MDSAQFEKIAEQVHIGWMREKQRQGFADHVFDWEGQWQPSGGCWKCALPRDKHHDDMLPYADLAENVQEYDRATVRAVLAGVEAIGLTVVERVP